MSYVAKGEKDYDATGAPIAPAQLHKIRITLTSSNVANLEKCKYSIFEMQMPKGLTVPAFASLPRLDQPCQGQGPPCQGPHSSSY